MTPRFWLPALVGIALLLFILGLNMPARLLPYFLDSQTIQISGVAGTLRAGTASRARLTFPGANFHLGQLSWEIAPLSLLRLTPRVQVSSVWGDQRASLALQLDGDSLELRAVDVNLNAALLKQVLPVELQGRLGLLFDEVTVRANDLLRADGRLVWQDAAWQSPGGRRVLGNYVATFTSPAEKQTRADIVTLSGPVQATGAVTLNERRYAIDLFIESSGQEFDAELAQALSLIASPEKNGYRLRLDGELSPGS
ncbi:type II secretion system protein N [Congregibacter variabilis]|uniref:Type II secretion system protein N n=1 Tax=Congregibacter variabilis TaxID=3081200 RepID=A0ABZ0I9Y9_9GAMM|nr:type II secretion system protein N [Congregibacter sp. IMCC43200]